MLKFIYIAHTNIFIDNIPILRFNLSHIVNNSSILLKDEDSPIYINLYKILKEAIINNLIPSEIKLPPSRILAKDLQISRSTVIKTYELLVLDKIITSKAGSGYFIAKKEQYTSIDIEAKSKNLIYPKISNRAKLFTKNSYLTTDFYSKKNIAFRPGLPPLDLFPVKKWKFIANNYWKLATPTKLSYAPTEGIDSLRISIANYLKIYRNIDCDYNQIIIASGSLHSLYLIGNALINKGDSIIMENPTFPRAYNLFKSLKASITPCNVDNNGLNINTVDIKNPKLIYTTPSNQYPLGVKMSYERRIELLKWVSKNNSLIIEDDYDHEFSNWGVSIPSIYSLDNEERVIYQGTFNKLLHPSLRIGYMIVPKYLINPIKAIYEQSSRFVPSANQEILNQFIVKDYLNHHLRNVIKVSEKRRNIFVDTTKDSLNIETSNLGLHLIGNIKNDMDDKKAFKLLLKNNVVAYPLSNYYISKEKKQGLVMGYSSVNSKVMREKTNIINQILK